MLITDFPSAALFPRAPAFARAPERVTGPPKVLLERCWTRHQAGQEHGGHGLVRKAELHPVLRVRARHLVGDDVEVGHDAEDLLLVGGGGADLEKMKISCGYKFQF